MSCLRTFAFLPLSLSIALTACGGDAPPPPKVPTKPIAPAEPPVDTSAVPEPQGLILFARVSKPEAALKTVGGWANLPLPGAADLVRSIADDAVADSVDMSQPIDAAAALGGRARDPRPLVAISVAVKSFDDANAKLSAKHKATPGKNGEIIIEGVGGGSPAQGKGPRDEDDDDASTCVLAHAPTGGRLICSGDRSALEILSPFMSRTLPRQQWPSDAHMEITLAALKEPLAQLRGMLPLLGRQLLGSSSPAASKVIEASVNELADIVNDTSRITIDAQIADAGLDATMKIDYASTTSLLAKVATAHPERADAPPAAFLHLPAETDLALYGRGSDPQLFDHMRELLGNLALEVTEGAQMPEQERKAVRELVIDRMLSLFTGALVYGKGFDSAALDKAIAARGSVKPKDLAAEDEADRIIAEQMIGWHLVQVNEPITKVGPILKDWSALWNKAEFTKWAKQQTSSKMLAQMHTGALPAGVTLPKDSMHLEIVIPRPDIEEGGPGPMPLGRPGAPPQPKAPAAKVKKIPVKPLTLHVLAVPDQGGTWVGFAMDAKLLAQKAAASLSTAPDANTLGKTATADALRDVKANGAVLVTLKGFLVFSALDRRSPYALLNALTSKGQTPIVLTAAAQPPAAGGAGSSIAKFKVPRGAIADLVQVGIKTAR